MCDIELELEAKAQALAELLIKEGLVMATAESCTGGWIAQTATALAGSSSWFDRGYVTYSNRAKMEALNVSQATLETFGAVSNETAAEMATGAVQAAQVDIAVAVTGIAGPDGGTAQKPVGTVCFGWAGATTPAIAKRLWFAGDRRSVRAQTVAAAIDGLIEMVNAGS